MKKTKRSKKIRTILLVLFTLGILYIGTSLYMSANLLITDTFQYDSTKIDEPLTITVLTDVHSHLFGKGNERLIASVEQANPDFILVPGDAMNWYEDDYEFPVEFMKQLRRISPVYFSLGNHEVYHMDVYKDYSLLEALKEAGINVVDSNYIDITVEDEALRIGGLYGSAYHSEYISEEEFSASDNYQFLADYEDTDAFKLMLAHQPDSFISDTEDIKWDIDLVLAGHEHGGQIRLPLVGAFYSPHMGWFPEYVDGTHVVNGIPMVISRGLSTYTKAHEEARMKIVPPRFNNIPEIVNIELN